MQERAGCLSIVLKLFGIQLAGQDIPDHSLTDQLGDDFAELDISDPGLPYRLRDDFLSAAERSFFGVLQTAVAGRAIIFAKVRVSDLLYVPRGDGSQGHQNRINPRHVDFVLCAADTLQPLAVIELDDASHQRADRINRDDFLDAAFAAAGLPLVRFTARRQYAPQQLAADLEPVLTRSPTAPAAAIATGPTSVPNCPKCGAEMVLRTASQGTRRGETFYGCRNYPRCRGTVPAP